MASRLFSAQLLAKSCQSFNPFPSMSQVKEPWFRVGEPLNQRRSVVLTIFSFILPVLIYCFISYASFLWDTDYEITLSAEPDDKVAFGATYVVGDVIKGEETFVEYQDAVRSDNEKLASLRATNGPYKGSPRTIRRDNKKLLKSFEPVLVANGWFDPQFKETLETKEYFNRLYDATFSTWQQIAAGSLTPSSETFSEENTEIVKKNWSLISAVSPTYDSKNFVSEPLYKLIPEGTKKIGRPSYIPAPHEILQRGWQDFTGNSELGELTVWQKYAESLQVVAIGFLIACVIGLPFALLAGTFSFFSRLIEPFVDFFRYMPAPAFSTVLVAVFGLAHAPKAALVVLGTLPHLILMVANTTRMIDNQLLDAAQTLGARRSVLMRKVIVPSILPSLYNDLRILLGWAWTWLVIAELIGEKSGLTEIIDVQGRRFNFDHVYPVILLIGITGFVTDQILSAFRSVLFPWTQGSSSGLLGRLISRRKRTA